VVTAQNRADLRIIVGKIAALAALAADEAMGFGFQSGQPPRFLELAGRM
jgi:hypothetical protein